MKYVDAIEMLANGSASAVSAKAGFTSNWLTNTVTRLRKGIAPYQSTIDKLHEAIPALPAMIKAGMVEGPTTHVRVPSPTLVAVNAARAAAKVERESKASPPPVNRSRSQSHRSPTPTQAAIMDKLAELDGKLNLLLIELGCNGAPT